MPNSNKNLEDLPLYAEKHDIETVSANSEGGRFVAEADPRYNIFTVPNGGYTLSLVAAASARLPKLVHPHAISTSARYHAPAQAGALDIVLERLGESRAFTTLGFRVYQKQSSEDALVLSGEMTMSDFAHLADIGSAPDAITLPPREVCTFSRTPMTEGGESGKMPSEQPESGSYATLQRVMQVHLDAHPMPHETPASVPQDAELQNPWHRGYIGIPETRLDTASLLFLADALPPPVFKAIGPIGWVPTIEFSVRVFADVAKVSADGRRELGVLCWLDGVRSGLGIERGYLTAPSGDVVAEFSQIFRVRTKDPHALKLLQRVESVRARPVL